MFEIFHKVAFSTAKNTTKEYSTSFSLAVKCLDRSIRQDIYNIYGFVRFADEIVDTFETYNQEELLDQFEKDMWQSLESGISLNPILHAFQHTVNKYEIDYDLITAFLKSMRLDLTKSEYKTDDEYKDYIYGSADVVGLMCLTVFLNGNNQKFNELKESALALGSAFQKVNFLRDFQHDLDSLGRSYFPGIQNNRLCDYTKQQITNEIRHDFDKAYEGIVRLPNSAKFGVYLAYVYYETLLKQIETSSVESILSSRIRVSNISKLKLLFTSFFQFKLRVIQ